MSQAATVSVRTSAGEMKALVKGPEEANRPIAVVYHDGPGVRPAVHEVADRMAAAGYLTVVPDLYYRLGEFPTFGGPPGSPEFDEMLAAIASVAAADVVGDTRALIGLLRQEHHFPAAVCLGFCIGANAALRNLESADCPFAAGAMFHPTFCVTESPDSPHLSVAAVKAGLYLSIGGADEVSPPTLNQPLLEAAAALERGVVEVQSGAGHGFMMSDAAHHDAAAAQRSWAGAEALFARAVGSC